MKTKDRRNKTIRSKTTAIFALMLFGLGLSAGTAFAADKPNIVVIWGDDTGRSNISAYTHGMMGYRTPNIDRIAKDGMFFTDITLRIAAGTPLYAWLLLADRAAHRAGGHRL